MAALFDGQPEGCGSPQAFHVQPPPPVVFPSFSPGPQYLDNPQQTAHYADPTADGIHNGRPDPARLEYAQPFSQPTPQHCFASPNIVVSHNCYTAAVPPPNSCRAPVDRKDTAHAGLSSITNVQLGSVINLATDILPMDAPHLFYDGLPAWHAPASTRLNQGAAFYDQLSSKFDRVMTSIDRDRYAGSESDLFPYAPAAPLHVIPSPATSVTAADSVPRPDTRHAAHSPPASSGVLTLIVPGNYFSKVDLYANSKLPLNLPSVRLYLASYRLLSLAAKYSDRAYLQPQGAERSAHIDADWRAGTKAMVIKSVPMDDANTVVFAIRGTANFMDWAVNLNMAPTSPSGFLDDPGNFCHAGFLSVARKMVSPVAARLRHLLEEDPGRSSYSLLITGHSAGGAVASLIYAHMLSTSAQASSELTRLTGFFRRIHCVTFGAPPVSLLPLEKPDRKELKKSLFYSFVNEGDPVVRADKTYVKSLLDLFATPDPAAKPRAPTTPSIDSSKMPRQRQDTSTDFLRPSRSSKSSRSHLGSSGTKNNSDRGKGGASHLSPVWKVPPATLSNAGRIVVLRSGTIRTCYTGKKTVNERLAEGVVAQFTSDEQLRGVIWGDPVCHVMKLYAGRIEALAIAAMMVDA